MPTPFAARSAPIFFVDAGIDVPKSIRTEPSLIDFEAALLKVLDHVSAH